MFANDWKSKLIPDWQLFPQLLLLLLVILSVWNTWKMQIILQRRFLYKINIGDLFRASIIIYPLNDQCSLRHNEPSIHMYMYMPPTWSLYYYFFRLCLTESYTFQIWGFFHISKWKFQIKNAPLCFCSLSYLGLDNYSKITIHMQTELCIEFLP